MPVKSFLIHDDIIPSFMKDLHNTQESCQGSFVSDNTFTKVWRRRVFSNGLLETKGLCHWVIGGSCDMHDAKNRSKGSARKIVGPIATKFANNSFLSSICH
ncbi:hypothetical protein AVEN_236739-1 [Araneus ventricosus]|uniref:Uncharacterized protein n=1 Tax=Araneus ventricosus TaxID=182803 RepID=A0A4Y2VZ23_ARAVE|nr:hypothetical protein AVEN_236739-1 [Araneus ventricosus]